MLIVLNYKCVPGSALDYQLVDVLRSISIYDRDAVINRFWLVGLLDLYTYHDGGCGDAAIKLLLPETPITDKEMSMPVLGERLLERSAMVHQFESGLFLRMFDPQKQTRLYSKIRLSDGPTTYQATNVDLEIRCGEAGPYEIVTDDIALIDHIKNQFKSTDIRG